jgi:hypothetical protein
MMKLIKYAFELIVPIALIFVVIPKVLSLVKNVLGFDEPKKKKKYKKPDYIRGRMLGTSPPPPKSRSMDFKMDGNINDYEVRGGRIVKKDQRVYDGEDSFTENGKKYTKSDELGWDIPWFKEDTSYSEPKKNTKNKHFKKGVDPDFL